METAKKMSLMQLTVLVAVNMMGSGIIMLPTNMAKVGAISLLSWIVTAVGSMAIAYGFAQAGIFNQRPGGMSAYARRRLRQAGLLHRLPAVLHFTGHRQRRHRDLGGGLPVDLLPGLSVTPIATCLSVIGLIWLTTAANFGGPIDHRQDRRGDGVGRDHPGGRPLGHRLVLVQAPTPSRRPGTRKA